MGGAEHFAVNLCNQLQDQGHDVTLLVTNPVSKYGYFADYLSPQVKLISIDRKSGPNIKLFKNIYKIIKKENPDIVHTHLGAIVYNCIAPFKLKNCKFIHTIHNDAKKEAETGGIISSIMRKFLFKFSKYIPVTISDESHLSFIKYYGKNKRETIIPNGVPEKEINIYKAPEILEAKQNNYLTLVNVARIMPQKNQILLAKVVNDLNRQGYKIKLFLIGNTETEEGTYIKSQNYTNVILLGPKSNPQDYMAASDAFILPSLYEGMPLTLIECFASQGFPICSAVGGINNMIKDKFNGLLINDPSSETNIKETILKFINMSPEERDLIKLNSKNSYKNYSMVKCSNNYCELYKINKL